MYRPFRPRSGLSREATHLRAWLRTSGASRLVCLFTRPKHKVDNGFQTSLEEAGVSRPGREAGNKNGQTRSAEGAAQKSCGPRFFHSFGDPPHGDVEMDSKRVSGEPGQVQLHASRGKVPVQDEAKVQVDVYVSQECCLSYWHL